MSEPSLAGSTALRLTGRDALLVLHRVSTQKLDDLAPGHARTTLFCDFRGRLLHRVAVAHAGDGAVWLLRDDAPGEALAAYMDRQVFREDVHIEDRSAELPVRLVRADPAHAIPDADADVAFVGGDVPALVPEHAGLALAVGDTSQSALDEPARLRAGRARHGHEIAEPFSPYEVNLASCVHLAKGCFTGQEVLLRLVTRNAVRRRLALLAGTGAAPAPQDVRAGGDVMGVLTSSAAQGEGWLGLAVLRLVALEPGAALLLADGTPLTSVEPFGAPRPLGRP